MMELPKDATIYPFPSAFNEKELDFVGRAIGYDVKKIYRRNGRLYFKPYRNRFYCDANDEVWNGLVKKGFAKSANTNKYGMVYFSVTHECLADLSLETSIYFYSANASGNEIDVRQDVIEVLLDQAVSYKYGWTPPSAKTIASVTRLPYKLTLATLNYLKKFGYAIYYHEGGIDEYGEVHCAHGWGLSLKWITENKERYNARIQEERRRKEEMGII